MTTIRSLEARKGFLRKSPFALIFSVRSRPSYDAGFAVEIAFVSCSPPDTGTVLDTFPDTPHPIGRKFVRLPLGTFQVAPIKTILSEKLHFRHFEVGNYPASKARQIILVCFLSHEPLLLARIATLRRHYDVIVTCARVCALSLMVQLQTIIGVVKTNACKLRR